MPRGLPRETVSQAHAPSKPTVLIEIKAHFAPISGFRRRKLAAPGSLAQSLTLRTPLPIGVLLGMRGFIMRDSSSKANMDRRLFLQGLGSAFCLSACCGDPPPPPKAPAAAPKALPTGPLAPASPETVGMSSARLNDVVARLEQRVVDELFPGFSAMAVKDGKIVLSHAFGKKARGGSDPMTIDTIFDLESMTKVVATSVAALILIERKKLKMEDPVVQYLPAFTGKDKEKVTVRDMLRYSSGLPIDNHFFDMPRDEIWKKMAETPLEHESGKQVGYSDLTYRLLGRVIEVASGTSLDVFCRDNIWKPLGMNDTMYNPPKSLLPRIAATGVNTRRPSLIHGVVQDDQDFELGGVVGCDGVFSTTSDLAIFAQTMLGAGTYNGTRILSEELARALVTSQTPYVDELAVDTSQLMNLLAAPKGYGFEIKTSRFSTAGMRFSPGSYGKVGGAGTFLWIDPQRNLFGVLLTNHGLPVPFDEPGWDRMLNHIAPGEFFDGLVNSIASA